MERLRTLHYSGILSKHNARFHTGVKRSHLDEGVIRFSELTPHRPHVPEEFTPRRRAEGLSGVRGELNGIAVQNFLTVFTFTRVFVNPT